MLSVFYILITGSVPTFVALFMNDTLFARAASEYPSKIAGVLRKYTGHVVL